MSQNQAHQNAPTSQGTQPTPMVLIVALVHVFCCVYQQYNSVKACSHVRICIEYAHRRCYLCTISRTQKYASRSSSRPQVLYMPLAKLCKAFACAEDFIPCFQTRTCQRCCQCDHSSIGTVATWAHRPGKNEAQQQSVNNKRSKRKSMDFAEH